MSIRNFWQTATVIGMAVILFISVIMGAAAGRKLSIARAVFSDAQELEKALEYFYNDQDRYPTAGEFSDQNSMGMYLSGLPAEERPAGPCTQSFSYKRSKSGSYELSLCLPAAYGGGAEGWNRITSDK